MDFIARGEFFATEPEIEFSGLNKLDCENITVDSSTRDYVRKLPYQKTLGEITEIEGVVTLIHPRRMTCDLNVSSKKYVTVNLEPDQFGSSYPCGKSINILKLFGNRSFSSFGYLPVFAQKTLQQCERIEIVCSWVCHLPIYNDIISY